MINGVLPSGRITKKKERGPFYGQMEEERGPFPFVRNSRPGGGVQIKICANGMKIPSKYTANLNAFQNFY